MVDLIRENPFATLAILVIISLIVLIISSIRYYKKDKKTAYKKILILLAIFVAFNGGYSIYLSKSNTFYDRNCESYSSMQAVVYYKTNGKAYKLVDDEFVSIDGADKFSADKAYVTQDGFLLYDKDGNIHDTELECFYKDDAGNKYYKATEVKWNSKGEVGIIIN